MSIGNETVLPGNYDGYTGTSEIVNFYEEKTIFLTGATGFLGKLLLEKLLRTCNGLNKVYILVRKKKGIEENCRLEELFSSPMWEPLQKINPNYRDKVSLMRGDIEQPKLGLSQESLEILKNEVNIIIHCAATVRFDQHIKKAAIINVRAVKDLIDICADIKKLDVLMHVSTAFSQCPNSYIEEKYYKAPMNPKDLLQLVEILDDDTLTKITPILLGEWPNTYTYTKAVAESLIENIDNNIAAAICRPSLVIGAHSEPLPGWIDNIYGPTGASLATGLGIIRAVNIRLDAQTDMVPSDYVINSIIAGSYHSSKQRSQRSSTSSKPSLPRIYNYCSLPTARITWQAFMDLSNEYMPKVASTRCLWVEMNPGRACVYHHKIAVFFLHTIPSYIIDLILLIKGEKPQAVKMYKKLDKALDVLSYFTLGEWDFAIDNTMDLWNWLTPADQKLFPFSMENFNAYKYYEDYWKGIRIYILKDPMETLPEGQRKQIILKIAHYKLCAFLITIMYLFVRLIFKCFF